MDIQLFFSVLRRFKWVVLIGFVLACALAFLSFVKVGPHGLEYRQHEKWVSTTRVLVTSSSQDPVQLAVTYAALATSDAVTKAAIRTHGIRGTLAADFGYTNRASTALPTVSVSATAGTPASSAVLANDTIPALQAVIARQQRESGVPFDKQAQLQLLNRAVPAEALVATPRSKTPPVVVFVLVMAATFGLVFILENLRPRVRVVPGEFAPQAGAAGESTRVRRQA